MLARTLGEWDRAGEHFERAIEMNRQMRSATWLAHTQYEYARLILASRTQQRQRARFLLEEADELAAGIGMSALRSRIRALGAPVAPATLPDVKLIEEINADEGVRWLFSFLSADRRRTYCLYEAPPDAIIAAARRGNIPVDEIVEVEPETVGVPGRPAEWVSAQGN
jgi:hypothetical protein